MSEKTSRRAQRFALFRDQGSVRRGLGLERRIEDIMRNRVTLKLGFEKALLLALVGILALTGPIAMGIVDGTGEPGAGLDAHWCSSSGRLLVDDCFLGGCTC